MDNLKEINDMAQELMSTDWEVMGKTVNVSDLGYTFAFDRAKQRLGKCSYKKREISISKYWCKHNPDAMKLFRDVVLHEIAHAISYHKFNSGGHSDTWKRCCVAIGARPERLQDVSEFNKIPHKYRAECDNCGRVFKRHRRPLKRRLACGACCKAAGGYSEKYALTWVETNHSLTQNHNK